MVKLYRRTGAMCCVLVLLMTDSPLGAQGLSVPSQSFGAVIIPEPDPVYQFGLDLNRFTELTKPSDSARIRNYALHRTLGLDLLSASVPFRLQSSSAIARLTVFGGVSNEWPTRYLQNDFLHHTLAFDTVPVAHRWAGPLGGVTAEINDWTDNSALRFRNARVVLPLFIGGGGTLSNIQSEMFVQAGWRMLRVDVGQVALPTVSFVLRGSFLERGGTVFPKGTIASDVVESQTVVSVPLNEWFRSSAFIPSVDYAIGSSSGLFLEEPTHDAHGAERRSHERLCTFALHWGGGDASVETWNDSCGNKDQGPTFGLRIYVRNRTWGRDKR